MSGLLRWPLHSACKQGRKGARLCSQGQEPFPSCSHSCAEPQLPLPAVSQQHPEAPLPGGTVVPSGMAKPWGRLLAVLAATGNNLHPAPVQGGLSQGLETQGWAQLVHGDESQHLRQEEVS